MSDLISFHPRYPPQCPYFGLHTPFRRTETRLRYFSYTLMPQRKGEDLRGCRVYYCRPFPRSHRKEVIEERQAGDSDNLPRCRQHDYLSLIDPVRNEFSFSSLFVLVRIGNAMSTSSIPGVIADFCVATLGLSLCVVAYDIGSSVSFVGPSYRSSH